LTLTLEITASSEAGPRGAPSHVFGEEGGTIGRAPKCTWVLPDKQVSGAHLEVTFRNGSFYVTDISRNGVVLNGLPRLAKGRPYPIKTIWYAAPAADRERRAPGRRIPRRRAGSAEILRFGRRTSSGAARAAAPRDR
jgi:hypothetical protein